MVIVAVVTKGEMTDSFCNSLPFRLTQRCGGGGGASNAFISRIKSPIAVGTKCSPPIGVTTCTVVTLVTGGRDN